MSNELVKASTVSVPAMRAVASLPELVERAGGTDETVPAEHTDAADRDRGPLRRVLQRVRNRFRAIFWFLTRMSHGFL